MALQLGQRPVHVLDAVDHQHGQGPDQHQDGEVGEIGGAERAREPRDRQTLAVGGEENHGSPCKGRCGRAR